MDDTRRSTGALIVEARGSEVIWVVQVRGLGVLVFKARWKPGSTAYDFTRMATFSNAEIGSDL